MQPSQIIGVSNLLIGLLVAGLSIPLILGKVRRNHWYGFRFSRSLESDRNWFEINRYGGVRLFWWSLAFSVVGIVVFFVPIAEESVPFWCLLAAPLLLLIPCFQAYRYGQQLGSVSKGSASESQDQQGT